ncbi:MAG: phosphatase PAP2 family protein [Desulfobacteraceae bacterium]|nr:MAG: phosphatase PAP2 family protein [Desulfobacteraceae bacterium]
MRSAAGAVRRVFDWIHRLRLDELPALVVLLMVAGGIWAFSEIASEMMEGETQDFDKMLILAMRNPADLSDPVGPFWVEEMGRDITALGSIGVLTLVTLSVAGFLILDGKRRASLLITATVVGGLIISTMMKMSFDRPRPDLVPHGAHVYTASFPSGHSAQSAVVYLTLGALLARVYRRRRLKAYVLFLAVLVTFLVGVSRVYLGVHWPTDVLGGWTLGATWALLCWMFAFWLQRRGEME